MGDKCSWRRMRQCTPADAVSGKDGVARINGQYFWSLKECGLARGGRTQKGRRQPRAGRGVQDVCEWVVQAQATVDRAEQYGNRSLQGNAKCAVMICLVVGSF